MMLRCSLLVVSVLLKKMVRFSYMKKIKVLHVFEPYFGGVPKYVETLLKYTDGNQIENIVVCSQRYNSEKISQFTKKIYHVDMVHKPNAVKDLLTIKKLKNIISINKPDIVYAHSTKAGFWARIAGISSGCKIIYNPHGWAFNMQQSTKKKKLYKWVEKILAHFCDKIVCISDAEKESALREKICKPSKLQVIYNGIDLEAIKNTIPKTRAELNIPEDAFVVGMVGRLSKQKAPDTFVKAAKLIKEKIPNAFFLMVGDGELRDQTEELINQYDLGSSFLITGWVDNPTAYMKIMDVGMLLSRWEGFGLVLPEYMACGVPIVATDVDAIPNIIRDGINGMLVDKDDYHKAADAVDGLFKQPDLTSSLVKTADNIVKTKFDGKRVAQNSEQLYKELI